LLTNALLPYRVPLYERLAARYDVEVLCWGESSYVPPWFADLDAQLAAARFPARRLDGAREALEVGRRHDAVIASYAGGAILPAAYAGARRRGRGFVLWASIWARPRSLRHDLARPVTDWIFRHADSVVAYGEHARRFTAAIRGRDEDVFVAPQSVEPELFRRPVSDAEVAEFRYQNGLGERPLVLYTGRLVQEKGLGVLAEAWPRVRDSASLVLVGEGPLRAGLVALPGVVALGPVPRAELPVAYRAASLTVLPSLPTPLFREPWGLVVNESLHQGTPVIVTSAVGAAAGGLVRDGETGLVIAPGDSQALAAAIERLLEDPGLARRLGEAGRDRAAVYTYEAMTDAFGRALEIALHRH
jgi:glycosyltransferase involved in cell wall biosynthesis